MFYIKYLFAEIYHRIGRTLTVVAGLAIASSLIILIMSASNTLSSAQQQVLNPLNNVGTDVLVTRSITANRLAEVDEATRQEFLAENSTITDLSQLGDPGEQFSNDQFKSESLITFEQSTIDQLDQNLVADYAEGLLLAVTHQEGTIPDVSVSVETGGETFKFGGPIEGLTDEEIALQQAVREQVLADLQAQGVDPRSDEGRAYMRAAMNDALPDRFKSNEQSFTTERRTITQQAGPIETDTETSTYKIGGVNIDKSTIGLILPSEIVEGEYLSSNNQSVINKAYAEKNELRIGDSISLKDKDYEVVGIVEPKLYSNSADIYLTLEELQSISENPDRINMLLVKATDVDSLGPTKAHLESVLSGAIVVTSENEADTISGSLVQAADLTDRFGQATAMIIIISAFVIVSLLTASSVTKRTREIGTLKAIGWSKFKVVRQIISENFVIGLIGAAIGVGFGLLAIAIFNSNNISLEAFIENPDATADLVRSSSTAISAIQTSVDIEISPSMGVFVIGIIVAIAGALISGLIAALKAARLKPQAALRNLE
ncbi:MAG: FtsX-like permease family protein [Candidatus Saccharimonadales bacterium]|nr:FtsX-like permease family protein [Candidatus Saccharimonadales bacterium]